MLFNNYCNEAEFRKQFVAPFLSRMGFEGVRETHGNTEFGCDFICWELHRMFGHRHYAVVVKHQAKLRRGRNAREVLDQIKQAFEKQIKTSFSPRPVHASIVIVLNSGTITESAYEGIWNDLRRERYGDNVVFLDGSQLASLSQFAIATETKKLRGLLVGLRAELMTTVNNVGLIIQNVMSPKHFEPMPMLTRSLEVLVSTPELHSKIPVHDCTWLLNALTLFRMRSERLVAIRGGVPSQMRRERQALQNTAISLRSDINRMLSNVETVFQSINASLISS